MICYLYATQDQDLLLKLTNDFSLNMYVDADFDGMWHKEHSHLRDCVLSRTGYVILFSGCPITWGSKLQTKIALSTTENEYRAFSTGARELLPLCQLLEDIGSNSFIHIPHSPISDSIHTITLRSLIVYEDNDACIAPPPLSAT